MRSMLRALLLGALLSAVLAPAADAVIAHTARGHLVSFQPLAAGAPRHLQRHMLGLAGASVAAGTPCTFSSSSFLPCLTYNGGPVMTSSTLTPIFWDPAGELGAGYQSEVDRFFTDLAAESMDTGNFFSVLPQYYEQLEESRAYASHHVSAGTPLTDEDPFPAGFEEACADPFSGSRTCVTDLGLRNELRSFIETHNLQTGIGHEYVVYFPPNVDTCFTANENPEKEDFCSGTAYCAYHGELEEVGGSGEVEYANEADNGEYGPGCDPQNVSAAQASVNTTSHEVSESVTDPIPAIPGLAWYDEGLRHPPVEPGEEPQWGEVGDICAWNFVQDSPPGIENIPNGGTNQTIDGHGYLLQTEWDNGRNTCSVSATAAGVAQPEAQIESSPSGTAPTGASISFDGAHSSAASGYAIVAYSWSFGDGAGSSAARPTHAYPGTEGAPSREYEVKLTVTDSLGQHATTTHKVTVTDRPPQALFTPPAGLVAGSAASFDGSASSDPDGHVVSYDWSWGDGSPDASGASASHTFATAGSYTVTLTVTDDAGSQERTSALVTVAAPPPPPPNPVVTPPTGGLSGSTAGTGQTGAGSSQSGSQGVLGFSTGKGKAPAKKHKKHKHKKRKHRRTRTRRH